MSIAVAFKTTYFFLQGRSQKSIWGLDFGCFFNELWENFCALLGYFNIGTDSLKVEKGNTTHKYRKILPFLYLFLSSIERSFLNNNLIIIFVFQISGCQTAP